jgi:hypothetical protein
MPRKESGFGRATSQEGSRQVSQRRPRYVYAPIRMVFLVDKVVLGQLNTVCSKQTFNLYTPEFISAWLLTVLLKNTSVTLFTYY